VERDPGAVTRRQQAAQARAAQEREERARAALTQLAALTRAREAQRNRTPREPRASSTDPDARVMKMSDGGYRPAYNLQFARALEAPIVVGVAVTNAGSDYGQLPPMLTQVQARYGRTPATVVADGGFAKMADLVTLSAPPYGCTVIAPVQQARKRGQDPYAPRRGDPPAVAAWRQRMATPAAQALVRQRPGAAEWVNAQVSNRGLRRVLVRGLAKVRAVALWHALAINLLQGSVLRAAAAVT
jgi:IS5 family transposase